VFKDPSFRQFLPSLAKTKTEYSNQNEKDENDKVIEAAFPVAMNLVQKLKLVEQSENRNEYLSIINRCEERIKTIDQALKS